MIKYLILIFLLIGISCHAENTHVIIPKKLCNDLLLKIDKENCKVIRVENLDFDANGFILVVYDWR